MTDLALSHHADTRMRQRGMREHDIELILDCATQMNDCEYLLTEKDAEREIRQRKREIQALERLRNRKVVVAGDLIVTAYHSRRSDRIRTLRRARSSK